MALLHVRAHRRTISILRCAVAAGEGGSSKLGVLPGGLTLSLFDMLLLVTGRKGCWRT